MSDSGSESRSRGRGRGPEGLATGGKMARLVAPSGFRTLRVWQLAREIVRNVYALTVAWAVLRLSR